MVFEGSSTKLVFSICKFTSTQKKKKKPKTKSCFGVQRNKSPEKINFINKPILALFKLKQETRAQKKT